MGDTVSFRLWPPVAIGLPLALGWAVTLLADDPWALPGARVPVGWVLVAFFVMWNGWCLLLFHRHRTGLLPGRPTTSMLERGPYRWSRNPLYLGMLVLYLGLACSCRRCGDSCSSRSPWSSSSGARSGRRSGSCARSSGRRTTRMRVGCGGGCEGARVMSVSGCAPYPDLNVRSCR